MPNKLLKVLCPHVKFVKNNEDSTINESNQDKSKKPFFLKAWA